MRVTYRANRMAVNARGAVSEVPSVLSSLLFVGNRESGIGNRKPPGCLAVQRVTSRGFYYSRFPIPDSR